jgi:aminomethyltransferase
MANTTPFESLHKTFGANFGNYHNWTLPSDYGDIATESEKLYSDCAAFDLSSFGKIEITGADTKKLIDAVTANNINITTGKWQWGIVCDDKGDLLDLLRIVLLPNVAVLLTSPPKRDMVVNLLNQCVEKLGLSNAQINDQTEQLVMLGLYGPNSGDVLAKMLPLDISDLSPGDAKTISVMMLNATIIRGSWLGCEGYEVITNAQAASMAGMMVGRFKESGIVTPAGMESLQTSFIEASLPITIHHAAHKKKFNPFNLGLGEFIDTEKEYIAKDALKEIKNTGTKFNAVMVKAPGVKQKHNNSYIQYDNGQIGWVESLVYSYKNNCGIGIALVDSSYSNLTEAIQIVGDQFVAGAELEKFKIKETLDGRI